MEHVLNWVWQGCAVALAAFAALRVLDRSRAHARYVLGGITLVVVVALPLLSWLPSGPPAVGGAPVGPASGDIAVAIPAAWWTSTTLVFSLWALWCAVHVVRLAAMVIAVGRARRTSVPCPAAVQSRLEWWTSVQDRGRPTRLVISPSVSSAAVLGCGAPVIALAASLLRHLTDDELDRIVLHEWSHVQRRDDLLNLVHLAIRAVAGWHPAVIALERQLRIEREAACDEMAVAVTGSPKRYAACLTTIAALGMGRQPSSALGAFSSPALERRVVRILSYSNLASATWSGRTTGFAVVLLVAISVLIAGVRPIAKAGSDAVQQRRTSTPVAIGPYNPLVPQSAARSVARGPLSSIVPSATGVLRNRPPLPGAPVRQTAMPAVPAAPHMDPQTLPDEPLPSTASQPVVALVRVHVRAAIAEVAAPLPTPPTDTPWRAAAYAGVTIGRGSQKAGSATAGFFSRVGKGIAHSFSN